MRSWKRLAAGVVLVLCGGVLGAGVLAATQSGGQSGVYPSRPPGGPPIALAFEIQGAPWGGSTTARRLGVTLRELTPAEATARKLPGHSAVLVETVQPKSPAEKAGIKPGDVILKINGEFARSIAQVRRLVNETAIGQQALVTISRDGRQVDLSVTPEPASPTQDLLPDDLEKRLQEFRDQLPDKLDQFRRNQPRLFQGPFSGREPYLSPFQPNPGQEPFNPWVPNRQFRWPLFESSPGAGRLGVVVQELGDQLAEYFKVKGGVLVATVAPQSPAAAAGLKAGDVITAVNGKDVTVPDGLLQILRNMKDGEEVTLSVVRAGQPLTIKVKLGSARGVWHV
jgi:serine protease Do